VLFWGIAFHLVPPTAFSSVWTRRHTFLDSISTEGASCFSGSVSAGTGVALSDAIVPAYTPEEIDACEVYTFAWHVGGKIQRSSQKLTASSPLKIDGWKTRFSLGLANFQGRELAVSWPNEGSFLLGGLLSQLRSSLGSKPVPKPEWHQKSTKFYVVESFHPSVIRNTWSFF